jgi:hypothetical protein
MGLPLPAPMLATLGPVPAGSGWGFEFKWDGVLGVIETAADLREQILHVRIVPLRQSKRVRRATGVTAQGHGRGYPGAGATPTVVSRPRIAAPQVMP